MSGDEFEKYIYENYSKVWEDQQLKTFTAWCNAHLRRVNIKIEAFEQDFRSGLKLMKLLEVISNDSLPAPDKGRMRFHKIANVNKALKFIEDHGVKLVSVGAEEIVDGNIKMTLGMIWTIILRFTIQNILVEDSSAKEGLLLWCKRKTNAYKNVRVENFKNSFQNGLAFCALIHSHDPSLIDYPTLLPNNAQHNLDLAFSIADKKFDVPRMLNVDDMISNDNSDERSIMAYVSSYYHAFNKRDKINAALNNISSIITARIDEDNCDKDNEVLSNDILQWIEKMIRDFEDQKDINDHESLVLKLKDFEQYKFKDKPKYTSCKIKLQFDTIKNHREIEKENLIRTKWIQIETLEYAYEKHLSEQRHRKEHIENLLNKFQINFEVQRAWISNKIDQLISKDYELLNLWELRTLSRIQETFLVSVGAQQSRIRKIVSIGNELRDLRYKNMKAIDEKIDIIVSPWDSLGSLNEQRVKSINTYLNALMKIDDLQLDFAKRATPLYNWIQQMNQDLNDKYNLHFIEEIRDLIISHKAFKKTVDEAHNELNQIQSLSNQICLIIHNIEIKKIPLNPYTEITLKDIEEGWDLLQRSIPQRDEFLQDSLEKEINNRECEFDFKIKIENIYSNLLDVQKTLFDTLSLKINAEKKETSFQMLQNKLKNLDINLRELETVYQKLDNYSKMDESKTTLSFQQMIITRDTLDNLISEGLRLSFNDHANTRVSNNLPRTRIQEFEACFRHFDKNNSGQLDFMQFRACLMSLGFSLEEDKKGFDQLLAEVDPGRTGQVSLGNYLSFMKRYYCNKGASERLAESFKILSNNQSFIKRDVIVHELPSVVANYCLENMKPLMSPGDDCGSNLDYNDFVMRLYN